MRTARWGNLPSGVDQLRQRDKSDYKLNSLSIGLGNNRDYLNKNYLCSKLVRTDKPTQEQVNQLSEKAQSLLNQMGVGQWQVSDAEVSEEIRGDTVEYRVMINAVPVLNETAAISDQPIENLTTYYGDTPEYTINVSTVPVFNGTSAARVPQIGKLLLCARYGLVRNR